MWRLASIVAVLLLATAGEGLAESESMHRRGHGHPECLPHKATTFEEFLEELKLVLDAHLLPRRPIDYVFSEEQFVPISCRGDWLEFGVASGGTINAAARWRKKFCGGDSRPVHGFDTFTGLPEDWDQVKEGKGGFVAGAFSQGGKFPEVEPNVRLHKGLFNETLSVWMLKSWARIEAEGGRITVHADEDGDNVPPVHPGSSSADTDGDDLHQARAITSGRRRLRSSLNVHAHVSSHGSHSSCKPPISQATWDRIPGAVSYIHIDCDLYLGAIEALTLLTDRIHPGTVLIFDELIGYPSYRQHEVKALWEWLQHSGRKVRAIGILDDRVESGNPNGVAEGMVLDMTEGKSWQRQSAAFIVA